MMHLRQNYRSMMLQRNQKMVDPEINLSTDFFKMQKIS